MVSEIVVIHHDQLCRFAFDLIQYILSLHTTKLVVLFNDVTSDEHKLSQDILAINTIFICWMQGRRAAMHQREWKAKDDKNNKHMKQKKKENRNNCESNIINQNISESFTEKDPEEMAWVNEICL